MDTRSIEEIFSDLRNLSQSEGALHEISSLIYRDLLVSVDLQQSQVIDDPQHRWSTNKLNQNEFLLLLGLMVQSQSDQTYAVVSSGGDFIQKADSLFREFHDRLNMDIANLFNHETMRYTETPELIGFSGREAIYYGAQGFYIHQLKQYSRIRYRDDSTWLLQQIGLSIRPMLDIANFLANRVNAQMTRMGHLRREGKIPGHGELTSSLLVSKSELRKKFDNKVEVFLDKFATPIMDANYNFSSPFHINQVAIAPIIEFREHLYICNQYRLYETIYESPFYWMLQDEDYKDKASIHRGAFLENTIAHILRSVFGKENVYENVEIRDDSNNDLGEIDVLVVYGEYVLVVQAKSKRVTLKARAGDTVALEDDFQKAIQDPYKQALSCLELIKEGEMCVTKEGNKIILPSLPRTFPIIVLSDHFPSSTLLSETLLHKGQNIAPVIWDLGILNCVARLLPTPIDMIFYLKSRSDVFDKVYSDSEYNFLGYHLTNKLSMYEEADTVMLDRDFATIVDDYMIAADFGLEPERPLGVLESLNIPLITELLEELKTAEPMAASLAIDLYDFSSDALKNFADTIANLRSEIEISGKVMKSFSLSTATGGITYVVAKNIDENTKQAASSIGAKYKYDFQKDQWYVLLDCVKTHNPIDGLLPLIWIWEKNENEQLRSEQIGKIFNSTKMDLPIRCS